MEPFEKSAAMWAPNLNLPQGLLTRLQAIVAREIPRKDHGMARRKLQKAIAAAFPDHRIAVKLPQERDAIGMSFLLYVDGEADQGLVFRLPSEDVRYYGGNDLGGFK